MQWGGRVREEQSGHSDFFSPPFYKKKRKKNGGREEETVTNISGMIPENTQYLL